MSKIYFWITFTVIVLLAAMYAAWKVFWFGMALMAFITKISFYIALVGIPILILVFWIRSRLKKSS